MEELNIDSWDQLCRCGGLTELQDYWELNGIENRRQLRRREMIIDILGQSRGQVHIDIGSAEGYVTCELEKVVPRVIAVDTEGSYLRKARAVCSRAEFVQASITDLPVRNSSTDSITVLEVLEHLPRKVIEKGMSEIDRVLRPGGSLIISVPLHEKIDFSHCERCHGLVPNNRSCHIASYDDEAVRAIVPKTYVLMRSEKGVNFPEITCSKLLTPLPYDLWVMVNRFFGHVKPGYWGFYRFEKTTRS